MKYLKVYFLFLVFGKVFNIKYDSSGQVYYSHLFKNSRCSNLLNIYFVKDKNVSVNIKLGEDETTPVTLDIKIFWSSLFFNRDTYLMLTTGTYTQEDFENFKEALEELKSTL